LARKRLARCLDGDGLILARVEPAIGRALHEGEVVVHADHRTLVAANVVDASAALHCWAFAGFLLVLGEVGALHVLASDATGRGWAYFVGVCLTVGGLMTLLSLFHSRLEMLSGKQRGLILFSLILLLSVATFAMYALDTWVAHDLPEDRC
jgi:hypothetical protein